MDLGRAVTLLFLGCVNSTGNVWILGNLFNTIDGLTDVHFYALACVRFMAYRSKLFSYGNPDFVCLTSSYVCTTQFKKKIVSLTIDTFVVSSSMRPQTMMYEVSKRNKKLIHSMIFGNSREGAADHVHRTDGRFTNFLRLGQKMTRSC